MSTLTIPGLDTTTGVITQIITIDAKLAAEWLARNAHNRTLTKQTVDQYAADMTNGRWHFNGQPIIFDGDGNLIDGQHRLTAQVRTGTAITWNVVTGVNPDSQDLVDIGKPRTVANQLQIAGHTFTNAVAAAARMEIIYQGDANPTKTQIREYSESHYGALAQAGAIGRSAAQIVRGSSAAYAVVYLHLQQVDEDAADEFFEAFIGGANLPAKSPILVARTEVSKRGSARGMTQAGRLQFIDYMFRVWNYWRDGKRVGSIAQPKGKVQPK